MSGLLSALEGYASSLDELQPSFYFGVSMGLIPFVLDAAFQEVSGISKQMETEDVVSGGQNLYSYRLPGRVKYENLVLRRGVAISGAVFSLWCATTLDGYFSLPIIPAHVLVTLYNYQHVPTMAWTFVDAYPVKWSMSDLKSQENTLLIETIELTYRYYFQV
jgi:phage tail-like protein